jgi:hypothetical protein
MGAFTMLIETLNAEGTGWQPLAPPETATGDSAAEVARWTATNLDVEEGPWRVIVWDGVDADTSADPAAEVYSNAL